MSNPGTDRIDLLDGDFYVNDPYSAYAWMRANEPVYWDSVNELWGIARYDDIVEIEKNKAVFISSDKNKGGFRPNIPADTSIIALDDPHHTVRRTLVSRRFTPRSVTKWEDHVRATVIDLIDTALGEDGPTEVVRGLAAPLPAQMIGLLLGFPDDMWRQLLDWSERTIALGGGPRYANDDGVSAVFEFAGAAQDLYEEKKECPADDVMSRWTEVEREGLGEYAFGLDEIIADCLLLLDGGAETTRTVIARTLVELARRPDQWEVLRSGADLTVATEEFIRFITPVHNMCRVATEDVEMGGVTVKASDQVVLMYPSGNRDEAHFDNAEELDVTRHPNNHLSFGFGTHFCLGAALARLEIRTFFEEFLARVSDISLTPGSPVVDMPNSFVYGLAEAHVDLTPA